MEEKNEVTMIKKAKMFRPTLRSFDDEDILYCRFEKIEGSPAQWLEDNVLNEPNEEEIDRRVLEYLDNLVKSGVKTVNILDMLYDLDIPVEKINNSMKKLEKSGLIKESDD